VWGGPALAELRQVIKAIVLGLVVVTAISGAASAQPGLTAPNVDLEPQYYVEPGVAVGGTGGGGLFAAAALEGGYRFGHHWWAHAMGLAGEITSGNWGAAQYHGTDAQARLGVEWRRGLFAFGIDAAYVRESMPGIPKFVPGDPRGELSYDGPAIVFRFGLDLRLADQLRFRPEAEFLGGKKMPVSPRSAARTTRAVASCSASRTSGSNSDNAS